MRALKKVKSMREMYSMGGKNEKEMIYERNKRNKEGRTELHVVHNKEMELIRDKRAVEH